MPDTSPPAQLLVDTDGGVTTLTLNRPEALNALTSGLRGELLAALRTAARDSAVRAVVLPAPAAPSAPAPTCVAAAASGSSAGC